MADDIDIRKAFEKPLRDMLLAYAETVAIDWPNETFDEAEHEIWVRPRLGDVQRSPKTLGFDPAEHTAGYFSIGCFLKQGLRQDRLDLLVKAVRDTYPYNLDLTAGGGRIQINHVAATGLLTPVKKAYRSVDITWSIEI